MDDPCLPSTDIKEIQQNPQQELYAMVDGSFLFTDYGWKEIKPGRIFQANTTKSSPYKWVMGPSEYVAQRGHYESFTTKFEKLLSPESACRKVFITDGANWITDWLTRYYLDSLQILDRTGDPVFSCL